MAALKLRLLACAEASILSRPNSVNMICLELVLSGQWARAKFHTDEIVIANIDPDDEPEQYLFVLAARPLAYWLAVEVWLHDGQVETINNLGEGVLQVEQSWPWPEDTR
jgi:hypothetical protein